MSLWGEIFALSYDRIMAVPERAGLAQHREMLLQIASGRVLEIGGGTGANLPFYGNDVKELVIVEPEDAMARRLRCKFHGYHIPFTIISVSAEQLPVPAKAFDYVVSTLVLCTVSRPVQALTEIRRVLKSGGKLLFIEHVRSDDPQIARWQDRFRRPWSWVGHGCQCNRATVDIVRSVGFSICSMQSLELEKVPSIVRALVIGVAEPTNTDQHDESTPLTSGFGSSEG